jgi:hypothetical protein
MVASAVFVTDLSGKAIISRNYRGDISLSASIDRFSRYLSETDEDAKSPVFHVDVHGDVAPDPESVGVAGTFERGGWFGIKLAWLGVRILVHCRRAKWSQYVTYSMYFCNVANQFPC